MGDGANRTRTGLSDIMRILGYKDRENTLSVEEFSSFERPLHTIVLMINVYFEVINGLCSNLVIQSYNYECI